MLAPASLLSDNRINVFLSNISARCVILAVGGLPVELITAVLSRFQTLGMESVVGRVLTAPAPSCST
jgi:hypothetical protein